MAENNLIKSADLVRVREREFVEMFGESIKKLVEMLGITRKIKKEAGTILKSYKAKGTLADGNVGEGETIPLSKYETEAIPYKEITLKKWRKATSAEAILEKGYDQAVDMTTDRMLKDVQKGIRSDFINFLSTGTGAATGTTLQAAIARTWGQLKVKFEDDDISAVYLINPLDIADYLATANITTQTAFGFTYVENFLGMGTVIMASGIPQGQLYATAAENIVLYFIGAGDGDLGEVFTFTTDETGYIGIHEEPDYTNVTASDTIISGIELFAERIDGVVVATIESAPHTYTEAELNAMTVEQIKALATRRGYTITGATKSALITSFLAAQNK